MDELEEKLKKLLESGGKRSKAGVLRAHLALIDSLLLAGYTHQAIVDSLRESGAVDMSIGVFRQTLARIRREGNPPTNPTGDLHPPVVADQEKAAAVTALVNTTPPTRRLRNPHIEDPKKPSEPTPQNLVDQVNKGRPDNKSTDKYFNE